MALPSLVALRLGERPEEAATDEWIRYDPDAEAARRRKAAEADADADAGAANNALGGQDDCCISGHDFERGEWVWRATRREHGGDLNYDPISYWRALEQRKGHDPTTTREVPEEAIRALAAGPPSQRADGVDGDDRDPRPVADQARVDALLLAQAGEVRRRAQAEAQRLREELRRRAYALIDQFGADNALNTLREVVDERNRQADAARRREAAEAERRRAFLEAIAEPVERAAAAARAVMAPPTRPWRSAESSAAAAAAWARGVNVSAAELDALPPWVSPESALGLSLSTLLSRIAPDYPEWWLPQYVRDSMWDVESRAEENHQQLLSWSRPVFRDTREQDNVLSVEWSSGPEPNSGIFTATLHVRADSHLGMVLFAAERSSNRLALGVFLHDQIVQQLEGGSTAAFTSAARAEIREFIRSWRTSLPSNGPGGGTAGLSTMFSVTLHDDHLQPEANAAGEWHGVRRIRIRCHQQFLRWLAIHANGSAGLVDGERLVAEAVRGRFSGLADNRGWAHAGLATLRRLLDDPPGVGAMRLDRIDREDVSAFFLDGYRIMRDMMASVVGMLHGYNRYMGEELRAANVTADHAQIGRRFGVYFPQFDPSREPRFRGPEVAPGFAGRQRVVATTRLWHALTQGARARAEEARPASSVVFPQV